MWTMLLWEQTIHSDMMEYDPIGHVASVHSFDDLIRAALAGGNAKKLLRL